MHKFRQCNLNNRQDRCCISGCSSLSAASHPATSIACHSTQAVGSGSDSLRPEERSFLCFTSRSSISCHSYKPTTARGQPGLGPLFDSQAVYAKHWEPRESQSSSWADLRDDCNAVASTAGPSCICTLLQRVVDLACGPHRRGRHGPYHMTAQHMHTQQDVEARANWYTNSTCEVEAQQISGTRQQQVVQQEVLPSTSPAQADDPIPLHPPLESSQVHDFMLPGLVPLQEDQHYQQQQRLLNADDLEMLFAAGGESSGMASTPSAEAVNVNVGPMGCTAPALMQQLMVSSHHEDMIDAESQADTTWQLPHHLVGLLSQRAMQLAQAASQAGDILYKPSTSTSRCLSPAPVPHAEAGATPPLPRAPPVHTVHRAQWSQHHSHTLLCLLAQLASVQSAQPRRAFRDGRSTATAGQLHVDSASFPWSTARSTVSLVGVEAVDCKEAVEHFCTASGISRDDLQLLLDVAKPVDRPCPSGTQCMPLADAVELLHACAVLGLDVHGGHPAAAAVGLAPKAAYRRETNTACPTDSIDASMQSWSGAITKQAAQTHLRGLDGTQLFMLLQCLPCLPALQAQARASPAWRSAVIRRLQRVLQGPSNMPSEPWQLVTALQAASGALYGGQPAAHQTPTAEQAVIVRLVFSASIARLGAYSGLELAALAKELATALGHSPGLAFPPAPLPPIPTHPSTRRVLRQGATQQVAGILTIGPAAQGSYSTMLESRSAASGVASGVHHALSESIPRIDNTLLAHSSRQGLPTTLSPQGVTPMVSWHTHTASGIQQPEVQARAMTQSMSGSAGLAERPVRGLASPGSGSGPGSGAGSGLGPGQAAGTAVQGITQPHAQEPSLSHPPRAWCTAYWEAVRGLMGTRLPGQMANNAPAHDRLLLPHAYLGAEVLATCVHAAARLNMLVGCQMALKLLACFGERCSGAGVGAIATFSAGLAAIARAHVAVLSLRHERLLQTLAEEAQPQLIDADALVLVTLVEGFAGLQYLPGAAWMKEHREACLTKQREFTPQLTQRMRQAYAALFGL